MYTQNTVNHSNEFIVLHGIPYLVGEYVDRSSFQHIDPIEIGSGVFVDQTPMRTVIDIQINDIDRNASDGRLSTISNSSLLTNMIEIMKNDWKQRGSHLGMLRRGIVARVYYQIENARTGVILRTMTEDLRIEDRNYFVYVNPADINETSLIVNFSDVKLTSVNQFTSGRDRMLLRITDLELYYESVQHDPIEPRSRPVPRPDQWTMIPYHAPESEEYYYHKRMQYRHDLSDWRLDAGRVPPDTWEMFNRFYHYDEERAFFQIHFGEVYDRRVRLVPMACGKIHINRMIMVNPGTQLVFKLAIWKNDCIIANNGAMIADALRIEQKLPINSRPYESYPLFPIPKHEHRPAPNPTPYSTPVDFAQNKVINQLASVVTELAAKVNQLVSAQSDSNSGEEENSGDDDEESSPTIPKLPESVLDLFVYQNTGDGTEDINIGVTGITNEEIRELVRNYMDEIP